MFGRTSNIYFELTTKKLLDSFSQTSTDEELAYQDKFVTHQQSLRDKEITRLLEEYVKAYQYKVKSGKVYRPIIFGICMLIIIAFATVLVWMVTQVIAISSEIKISGLAAFITACVTFLSLIIGLLTIITKYFFPEDDEKYITQIVESIQSNDLENKRENAKNREITSQLESITSDIEDT